MALWLQCEGCFSANITDISNETRQIREKPWIYLEQTPRFNDLKRKKEEKVLKEWKKQNVLCRRKYVLQMPFSCVALLLSLQPKFFINLTFA